MTVEPNTGGARTAQAIYDWDHLLGAYRKAAKGKRGKPAVAAFEHRLEENLLRLQTELRTHTYRPGPYTHFYVHEPKRRRISAASFRDRVVHHALCTLIEPRFERAFVADSYANRVGKGTHRALDAAQHGARRFRYVLSCDLRLFFPSIDHALLRAALCRKVAEPDLRWLIDLILESGREGLATAAYRPEPFPGDDLFAALRPRGLPIGNLTSQFWANVFLNPLDHFIKRELGCPAYVRYVDDFLLFADAKETLWRWKAALRHRLTALRLTMHPGAHPRPVTEGFGFLGFVITPERRRLKRRKGLHYRRTLARLIQDYRAGGRGREDVRASMAGWVNHTRYGNTVGLRKALFNALLPGMHTPRSEHAPRPDGSANLERDRP